jgi:hypothetical protein
MNHGRLCMTSNEYFNSNRLLCQLRCLRLPKEVVVVAEDPVCVVTYYIQ